MKRKFLRVMACFSAQQAGNALILVIIFLMLGSLTLVPTLSHIGTSLKTGQIYEAHTDENYAADSGVEDAIWEIKYDQLAYLFLDQGYHPYKYNTPWDYTLDTPVNGYSPNITIESVWIPKRAVDDDSLQPPTDLNAINQAYYTNKLMVSGTAPPATTEYEIILNFTPDETMGDNLTIKSIGVWLPQGFTYDTTQASSLEDDISKPYYSVPQIFPHCGGEAIVWDIPSAPAITEFPDYALDGDVQTCRISFHYIPEVSGTAPTAIAWMETDDYAWITDILPVTWDVDTKIYRITSTAGSCEVEAYTSRCELRDMNDAIAGDYVAVGNSLMTDEYGHDYIKDTIHSESDYTLNTIPANADVIAAYLYWSGWRNNSARTDLLVESCNNLNNWDISGGTIVTNTQAPTGDGDSSGSWSRTPSGYPNNYYSRVDEIPSDGDSTYITSPTSGTPYRLFSFPSFSIPTDATITNITIYIEAKKSSSSGSPRLYSAVKIRNGSNPYVSSSYSSLTTNWETYSYSWTENPKTSSSWTPTDLNNSNSTNGLQQFGVYCTSPSPGVKVSMVYAEVSYTQSLWTSTGSEFRFQGDSGGTTAERTLTLKNGLDLHTYAPGTVGIYWDQRVSGTLEDDDTMYFAFSSNGGTTWSSNIEAFHGSSLNDLFLYSIPDSYLTSNFKIRFFCNFNSSSEYAYLDNIRISYMPADTEVIFKIDDQQVYLDGSGDPCEGVMPLTASKIQTMIDPWAPTIVNGFSYSCYRDITRLVQAYPIVAGEEHHTGNAKYTVGGVAADTGEHISYAGWSMIIIYASPETGGHYLYLWDPFTFHPGQGQDLDFDQNGTPGGDVTGFIIPEPIRNGAGQITEPVAAHLTCFVGEGDEVWTPEYIKITGQQTTGPGDHDMYLSNPNSPWNNVWNSRSYPASSYEGVDVDTFEITWDDDILTPKDTSLHIDIVSNQDAFNLVYIILSVRSKTVTGGTTHYVIHGG